MARKKKADPKRPIESYEHTDKKRVNNPPVGLVTPDTRTLEVEFHSGGVYQYSGVPDNVHQGLMRAASKGSYFYDHIKDRYPYWQMR
jgi:hypothetical protein